MRQLKFGVEIEFFKSGTGRQESQQLCDKIEAKGIVITNRCSSYRRNMNIEGWQLTYDSSVGGSALGLELISPILYERDGLDQLKVVLGVLMEEGFKVDRSCGIHIHHDCNDYSKDDLVSLMNLYYNHQTGMSSIVSKSRRRGGSGYCKPLDRNDLKRMNSYNDSDGYSIRDVARLQDRYRALNTRSFLRHGTMEFRQHQGSLNYKKIEAYIVLTFLMVCHAKETSIVMGPHSRGTLKRLLKVVNLEGTYVGDFFIERAAEFKRREAEAC